MADQETYTSPAEIRHRIGPNGNFTLNNVSGDVRVRGGETDEVTVLARWSGRGDREMPLTVRRTESSLHIETDERSGIFSFRNHGSIEFDVTVPRGARLDVAAVSGDIEAEGLAGEQSYKSISGDLDLQGCGGRVSATTVSGDIQLAALDSVELNLTTTSGDIEAAAPTFPLVRIRTVSGDMTLRGGFAAGPQHTIESVSGDLNIEPTSGLTVDTKRGLDFAKSSKRPLVTGDGRAQLRFRSLSGDVHVGGARRVDAPPMPPQPGEPAFPARPPMPPMPPEPPRPPQPSGDDSLEVLRALERGEIDVEEASRRLEGASSRG